MNLKIVVVGALLAILCLPVGAYSQKEINTAGVPDGTILLVAREDTGIPGYVHEKYALVDQYCSTVEYVDYYGPSINPNDAKLITREQKICVDLMYDKGDTD
jgi:hypothetical protein